MMATQPVVTLGRMIRQRREARGMLQATLARNLGVTQTCVSYWETGKREPRFRDLTAIAAALSIPVAMLVAEPGCLTCMDMPPPGFMCLTCRQAAPLNGTSPGRTTDAT